MTHANEPIWNAEGAQKRAAVQGMFADIAPSYDRLNAWMSLSLHRRWRARAVQMLDLKPGNRALDVCSGTGDFLPPLRAAVGDRGSVTGIDFCAPMLAQAKTKSAAGLALGDACQLPVAANAVDAVTVGWGIRNVPDIDAAHAEIARVLRKGGRFVSIDMAQPRNPLIRAVSKFVFNTVVPRLGALFGKTEAYRYLPKSTERFSSREQLAASMERAGLTDVRYTDLFFGNLCIHYGRKP
jgi:demethylmenaquinone methyltransferase/2-methoxy-6-polyprenyl-1,4-benzoquinol methylase